MSVKLIVVAVESMQVSFEACLIFFIIKFETLGTVLQLSCLKTTYSQSK